MKNLVSLDYLIKKIRTIPILNNNVKAVGYSKYPHKYFVVFKNNKTVNFGHQDYEDTLYRQYINKDKDYILTRRRLYRIRHNKEKNQKYDTPGFLSYFVLW